MLHCKKVCTFIFLYLSNILILSPLLKMSLIDEKPEPMQLILVSVSGHPAQRLSLPLFNTRFVALNQQLNVCWLINLSWFGRREGERDEPNAWCEKNACSMLEYSGFYRIPTI